MSIRFFKIFALMWVMPFMFLGCSEEYDEDYYDCSFETIIKIRPEGAGRVERKFVPSGGWGGLKEHYELTAIPNEGFAFKKWRYPEDGETSTDNPEWISCEFGPEAITAVFEEIVE